MEPHPEGETYVAEEGPYATSSSTIPVLHYYPARGRAEVIRLCLAYERQTWFEPAPADIVAIDELKGQELDGYWFRQLPRFIDEVNGPVDIVQSMAILRHLGRKFELYGTDLLKAAKIDMIIDGCQDIRAKLKDAVFGGEATRSSYVGAVMVPEAQLISSSMEGPGMACLEKLAGCYPGPWMVGEDFSIADIMVWDLIDTHYQLFPEAMKTFPLLSAHYKAVAEAPGISAYLQSKNRHSLMWGADWIKEHRTTSTA